MSFEALVSKGKRGSLSDFEGGALRGRSGAGANYNPSRVFSHFVRVTRSWDGLWRSNRVRSKERATAPPIYGPCWDRLN
jgi:hypothetical protein